MCGRYPDALHYKDLSKYFAAVARLDEEFGFTPRYNIAPTQQAPIVREDDREPLQLATYSGTRMCDLGLSPWPTPWRPRRNRSKSAGYGAMLLRLDDGARMTALRGHRAGYPSIGRKRIWAEKRRTGRALAETFYIEPVAPF